MPTEPLTACEREEIRVGVDRGEIDAVIGRRRRLHGSRRGVAAYRSPDPVERLLIPASKRPRPTRDVPVGDLTHRR